MLAALMMSLALTSPAVCDAEHETPECAAEQIAEATRNLSLPPIQAEFDAGVQVYRAVFNGGDRGQPAISFERRLGRSPELVLYGAGGQTLRREVGVDIWETVVERSRYVGRKLEPIPGRSISCLVSWDVVVQIASPRQIQPNENADLIRSLPIYSAGPLEADQNSCEGGLTWDYGAFLADLACEEIPECDAMGPRDHSMIAVQHLEAVFQLRGDRVAAASLSRGSGWAPSRGGRDQPVDAARFAKWLEPEYGATLDWGGTLTKAEQRYDDPSPDAISRFLAEQDVAVDGLSFEAAEIGADSAEIGWASGTAGSGVRTNGAWTRYEAPYRQVWLRHGDHWRLWSMTVGAFAVGGTEVH